MYTHTRIVYVFAASAELTLTRRVPGLRAPSPRSEKGSNRHVCLSTPSS